MKRPACGGFTLVELLVVIMIMSLFVGLARVVVRPDPRAILRLEAERLARLLEVAGDEAGFSGSAIAWTATAEGYRFSRWREGAGWQPLQDDDLLHERSLPANMTIAGLQVENMHSQNALRLEFMPYAPPLFFTIELVYADARYAVASSRGGVRATMEGGHGQPPL